MIEIPFFAFPPHVRRVFYPTNAIENNNSQLRKIIKTRRPFPGDDAATKLIWLALRNITECRERAARDWKEAMNQFAILYEDRFTRTGARYHDRRLSHRVCRSSQATPAAVEKSPPASNKKIRRFHSLSNRVSVVAGPLRSLRCEYCASSNVSTSRRSLPEYTPGPAFPNHLDSAAVLANVDVSPVRGSGSKEHRGID